MHGSSFLYTWNLGYRTVCVQLQFNGLIDLLKTAVGCFVSNWRNNYILYLATFFQEGSFDLLLLSRGCACRG